MTDIKNHDQTLSIVIPCYNEGKNIPLIVERLSSLLKDRRDVQVVLVDNGSNDLSFSNIDQLIEGKACFTVCRVENNQGYGFGILSGLKSATGTVLSWTHADLQTDPQDVLHAFDLYLRSLQAHPQMIIKGERRNRKAMEKLFTFGMQLIASSALRAPLSDINAQPKLFSRRFYQDFLIKEAPWDFSLDLFLLYQAKRHGFEVLTVPVDFADRIHGEAKGGGSWKTRYKLMRRTFKYIFELKRKVQSLN